MQWGRFDGFDAGGNIRKLGGLLRANPSETSHASGRKAGSLQARKSGNTHIVPPQNELPQEPKSNNKN